jgi:hypothetical protein
MVRKLLSSFLFSKRQSSGITTIGTLTYLVILLLGIVAGVGLATKRVPFWPRGEDAWCMHVELEPGYSWDNPQYSKTYEIRFKVWNDFDSWFNTAGWFTSYDGDYIWSTEGYWGLPGRLMPGEYRPVTLTVKMKDDWLGTPVAQAKFIVAARGLCMGTSCTGCDKDEYLTLTFGSGPSPTPTPPPERVSARGRVVKAGDASIQISGAQVRVEGETGMTDDYGLFLIPGVSKKAGHPDVTYHIKIEKEGYQPLEEDRRPSGVLTNESTADFGEIGLTQLPTPTPVEKSDLTCSNITLNPSEPVDGQNVEVRFTVSNIGDAEAEWHWEEIYIDDQLIARPAFIFDLAPGESMEGGAGSWLATAGSHTAKVKIDATDRIEESNEDNNERTRRFAVGAVPTPAPPLSPTPSPSGLPTPTPTPTPSPTPIQGCSGISYFLNPEWPLPNTTVTVNISRSGASSCYTGDHKWDDVGLKLDGVSQSLSRCNADGSHCNEGYHAYINSGAVGTHTLQFTVHNDDCWCNVGTFTTTLTPPTPAPTPPPPPPPPPPVDCRSRNCRDNNPAWLDRVFYFKPNESGAYSDSNCTQSIADLTSYCTSSALRQADFNGDLEVNTLDFGYLISGSGCWTSDFDSRTDFNNDGVCNAIDVSYFFSAWTLQNESRE